ncbi:MAG: prephenate dehydrogenase/arogenate dehydrogenase family protein [Candidatus Micrarchaeota archaeon]
MALKICIVGGTGAFGVFYAKLFSRYGFNVTIAGRNPKKAAKTARSLKCKSAPFERAVSSSDVVIISVPIEATPKVIARAIPFMRRNSLLMDFTSVKAEAVKAMKRARCREVVSCHPMHGPNMHSIKGQAVIFVPIRKGPKYKAIRQFFEQSKAQCCECSAEEHDKVLSVVQVLAHALFINAASTICALNIDAKKARAFSTPIYKLASTAMARIFSQEPELYAQIQMRNPYAQSAHNEFIKQARALAEIVEKKDSRAFDSLFRKAAKHLKK